MQELVGKDDQSSEASWTPASSVELEAHLVRRSLRRHDMLALTLGMLACVAVTALGAGLAYLLPQPFNWLVGIGSIIGGFKLASLVDRRRNEIVEEGQRSDRVLESEFGSEEGWLVNLIISQGGAATGSDRGMLWFEDDRLYFSGHRASFALSRDQVVGKCAEKMRIDGLRYKLNFDLDRQTAAGTLRISFEPSYDRDNYAVMLGRTQHWLSETGTATGQWPPTTLGPGVLSMPQLLGRAICGTALWIAFGLTVVTMFSTAWLFLFLILILGTKVTAPLSYWRAWTALRKVRRDTTHLPSTSQ